MTKTKLSILAIMLAVAIVGVNESFATSVTNVKMADDTYTRVKFTFREGVEETYFPVFKMTSDLAANDQPTFQLEGTVGDYPYLHQAMEQAYKYREAASTVNYELKQFVVDVDFVKSGNVQKSLHYFDCRITNSAVNTLTDNAEGFTTTKTGFAIVDVIDFVCSGLQLRSEEVEPNYSSYYQNEMKEYSKVSFNMAEGVHSWVTFAFNDGMEKIDFPVFKMISGFDEKSTQRPSFTLQGIPSPHPLLDNAVNKAKVLARAPSSVANDDFQAKVELGNDAEVFRTLYYSDCRVDNYIVDTQTDNEEGYTGKSGNAVTENITISCAGITTKNHPGNSNNSVIPNNYIMGGRTHAVATIKKDTGETESIDFPIYKQTFSTNSRTITGGSKTNVIDLRLNPAFELQGVHKETPLLYSLVDLVRTRGQISGTDHQETFAVDVDLKHDDVTVVTHHYTYCRVTNYLATTLFNKDEGYIGANGFAQVGTYDFECKGYQPDTPSYDALFVKEKAKNVSSHDLRDTSEWSPVFKYSGNY